MSMLGTPAYDVTELPPVIAAAVVVGWASVSVGVYTIALFRRDA